MIDASFAGTKIIQGDLLHILPQLPDNLLGGRHRDVATLKLD